MTAPDFITAPERTAVKRFVEWAKTSIIEEWVCCPFSDAVRFGHDHCVAGYVALEMISLLEKEVEKSDRDRA